MLDILNEYAIDRGLESSIETCNELIITSNDSNIKLSFEVLNGVLSVVINTSIEFNKRTETESDSKDNITINYAKNLIDTL